MGGECLDALNHRLPDGYILNTHEQIDLYRRLTKRFVIPELINVVDGEAIWRVPYCAEGRGARKGITEAIASLLADVSAGRYRVCGVGTRQFEGDIFLKGPLRDFEYEKLVHGQFPPTVKHLGRPGPGLCEAPEQALLVQPTSLHPPRASGGRGHDYNGYDVGYDAPPPRQVHPSQQLIPPNHSRLSHQPRGSRRPGGSYQPGNPRGTQFTQGPKPPRKFTTPASESSPDSNDSSAEDSDSPTPTPKAKAKKRIAKAQRKPTRRPKSLSENSVASDVGDLTLSDHEADGYRPPKHAAKKPPRRVGRSHDEDEIRAPNPPRRPAAQGPPERGPLDTTEIRDFAPAAGEFPRRHHGAPKPGRRIGRSDDEADEATPAQGQRPAGPPGRGGQRAPVVRKRVVLEEEKPPELDPAEKARLDALKAANGFGKGGMP
ncbi:MAG: hypothetical protein Q9184_002128 [Pyrenodesmia sp. 2 TL-2023]